ncbi:MAG: DUF1724 domain-containing protein [Methanobacteriaceae archaeon]|nr:DUF1724 domain-containing protein [Methanobacteriaceae archaeon]
MVGYEYLFLDIYDDLTNEIRFLCNSEVRIKILKSLSNNPKTMRELNDLALLSYSSVSNNLGKLEDEGFLVKNDRKYYLTNIATLNLLNCLDFNNSISISNIFSDFLKTHDISPLCDDSLRDISSLNGSQLVESVSIDIYKPHNQFKSNIESANTLKVIFPYLHPDYPKMIKKLLAKGVSIEVLVNKDILDIFIGQLGLKYVKNAIYEGKLSLKYLTTNVKLSLAIGDNFVSIGLFKLDGSFDHNRLIISKEASAISWGEDLFESHNKTALFVKVD